MSDAESKGLLSHNFAELLRGAARTHCTRTAILFRGRSISFHDLAGRAAGIAAALRGANVRIGDRCAVLLKDPTDAAAAFFAVLSLGGVAVNVSDVYRPRQLEHVIRNARASVLITSGGMLEEQGRTLDITAHVLRVDDVPVAECDLTVETVAPDDPGQITYTSGSTGQPKGVVTSHAALWAGVRIVAEYLGLRREDRIASVLPFSFVYGFNQLTTSLYTGATLVVERSTLAAEIVENLRRERVTVVAAVPSLWQQLLNVSSFREQPLDDLRVMTCAGGRLPRTAVRELRRAQPQAQLYLMYGLTEVFRSTYLPPHLVDSHPDSMGRPIPESTVYIVGDDGQLAAAGEVGELVHGGPTVGMGYFEDPESTARVFRKNPFLKDGETGPARVAFSGDLVRRDEHGLLYYVGRRDRVIKTLGFRVSPDEILDVAQASGLVSDAAILTEPDPVRGERIIACVVLKDPAALDRLIAFCRRELPRHMQPSRYVVLPVIPHNAHGKHDLLMLRRKVAEQSSAAG